MQRDVEKVEEIYRAYAKRQVNAVLMHLSKEVEIFQSSELPWGGQYTGHEGARQFLGALGEHLEARLLLERLLDAGDRVVAVGRTVGKARTTQLEFDVPVVHVWTFQEGQVVRWETYLDNATILTALGVL